MIDTAYILITELSAR